MSTDPSKPSFTPAPIPKNTDASKLTSLLALAAGAAVMPQVSKADIIYTDLSANPVSVVGTNGSSFLIDNLPGTAILGFTGRTHQNPAQTLTTHSVRASQRGGFVRLRTNVGGYLVLVGPGVTWYKIGVESTRGYAAVANQISHNPSSFDHLYMMFDFKDSTLPNSPRRYGWADLGLINGTGLVPHVTIYGYAWDNTGATIPTGVTTIPEPAPVAILALGALALGAPGLRALRRNRAVANQP